MKHMRDAVPHASLIGFTSASIDLTDKNTRAVTAQPARPYSHAAAF
jgi:hypothetical protein